MGWERDKGVGPQRGKRPFTGRLEEMFGNQRVLCYADKFLGKKVSVVIALFLVQAYFQCKFKQLRERQSFS